ncbi:MAG: glycosyltransferase family 4 protein [Bacillota bacterium]|nr:glycosyltransferase family 4 protein [Bacillota bacterium]
MPPAWVMEGEGTQYVFELAVLKMCDLSQYDLIHVHDVHSARALSRLRRTRPPVILTAHGLLAYEGIVEQTIPADASIEWRYSFLRERTGLMSCDLIMVPCEWMRRQYTEVFGVPPDKVVTVPLGIDAAVWSRAGPPPSDLKWRLSGCRIVTCIARLVRLKGHDTLLHAMDIVRRRVPDVRCLIVGDGPQAGELKQLATRLDLGETVLFLGRRSDVPDLLSTTDVFVLASLLELTPLSIIEAQMAGRAVVCTDVGGVPDLVENGRTGILIPPQDPVALSQAVIGLLCDSARRRRLGALARQEALAKRTLSSHMDRLTQIYARMRESADCSEMSLENRLVRGSPESGRRR